MSDGSSQEPTHDPAASKEWINALQITWPSACCASDGSNTDRCGGNSGRGPTAFITMSLSLAISWRFLGLFGRCAPKIRKNQHLRKDTTPNYHGPSPIERELLFLSRQNSRFRNDCSPKQTYALGISLNLIDISDFVDTQDQICTWGRVSGRSRGAR